MALSLIVLCCQDLCAQDMVMGIDGLFRLADENSVSIQTFSTGIDAAEEALKDAKSQRLPDISASLSVSFLGDGRIWDRDFGNGMKVDIPSFGNDFAIEASQVIYAGGAVDSGVEMARLGKRMAELDWQQRAGQSSIDLQRSELGVRMNEQSLRLERSARLPRIAVVAADHLDGPVTIEVPALDNNFNYWYVGLGIRYDLSSLFKSGKKISQARLNVRRARESFQLAREQVENAVQAGYVNFMTSFTDLKTQEKTVELADQNYEVISYRYENGLALLTDMLDASNMKLSAGLALLNLSYTVITATCDGMTGHKDIHEGQLVQPGQTMVEIVDGTGLWVIANYRETQLRHIREGAGVPVRISLSGNDPGDLKLLRAGLNVECKVRY